MAFQLCWNVCIIFSFEVIHIQRKLANSSHCLTCVSLLKSVENARINVFLWTLNTSTIALERGVLFFMLVFNVCVIVCSWCMFYVLVYARVSTLTVNIIRFIRAPKQCLNRRLIWSEHKCPLLCKIVQADPTVCNWKLQIILTTSQSKYTLENTLTVDIIWFIRSPELCFNWGLIWCEHKCSLLCKIV